MRNYLLRRLNAVRPGVILTVLLWLTTGLVGCEAQSGQTMMATETTNPPVETPAPAVSVWVTYGDKSKLLQPDTAVTFTTTTPDLPTIHIDPNIRFQQIEGVGAAMTDSAAWLLMRVLPEKQRQQVMADLFTREGNGIGLNYIRVPMGASDFALHTYSYNDRPEGEADPDLTHFSINYDEAYIIPALQLAQAANPSLRFMGSPWSAPAWMKAGESMNGNALRPEYYQSFADYHVRFVQAYAAAGLPITAVTPQNEPMHDTRSYPSMYMPARIQQTFVRDYLGPAFQQAGLDTQILILDHNWDLWEYALEVLSDPAAAAYVDGIAFHCYAGDVANQALVREAYPDKGIWFTECSGGRWATDFGDNMSWNLNNLVIGNFRNWGSSLLLWNLALDEQDGPQNGGCGNCRGVITINQRTGEVTYNEEYYILGHVSKFVDRGAFHVASSDEGTGPNHVAFVNPDGSMALVVQADEAVSFAVSVSNGRFFNYTLPAHTTATFVWNEAG